MIKIDYPSYQPKVKTENEKTFIFDSIRKRWISLTPEEWVRQNILQYLMQVKKYPAKLIAVEKEFRLGDLKKRFDIVVYDKNASPWMLIECKEMDVILDKKVLDQLLLYNITLKVPFLMITNGSYCFAFSNINGNMSELNELPSF